MKHVRQTSKAKPLVAASYRGAPITNPCEGLTGLELKKCEKKACKGGVVY